MQHAAGFRYIWRVPANLRGSPWYRAEVRIWEDGKPLPLRVERPESVSDQGNGRFGVSPFSVGDEQKELVWFSASDNTNPAVNGRSYEFEMRRTNYRFAILAAASLAFSVLASLIAIPATFWSCLIDGVAKPGNARLVLLRRLAICLAVLAGITVLQAWPPARIAMRLRVPSARLIQSENQFSYRLPRWIEQGVAQGFATLYEDGKPLKRASSWAWKSESGAGSFYCTWDRLPKLYFRTGDGSNAALNGRSYTVKVPLFPPQLAPRLALLLALVSSLLFICAPQLAMAPVRPSGSWFAPWFKSTGWRWTILILGLAKMWVVAGDEMLPQVYDSHVYARSARALVWGDDFIIIPAGFSMFAGIIAQFGSLGGWPWNSFTSPPVRSSPLKLSRSSVRV